jgi:hypothetical protein
MMLMMGVQIGSSLYYASKNSGDDSGKLRESIRQMNKKIQDYTNNYKKLLTDIAQQKVIITDEIQSDIVEINTYSQKIRFLKTSHDIIYRNMQISGIIFISTIGLLLILKLFGYYDMLNEILLYPFKKVYNML